ncbi:SH3 domain-containing C40 family peptidase [Aureibaculum sp. 2210JD6-5]|uniref:SH3 domain-containing C40 family peptidase n=1 Tax=Aureibaculum sp. 2210JD6-5 TaxID=3103957 RepID=UPI002AAD3430|nr:SH3 domain-containing C40 family peptidase [Aureibaculum sp. 2210JD6-5]MDY7394129.1 SH3 domain-containing C40 family peptidase [Aureibaculum sp. 2210JD6-5]
MKLHNYIYLVLICSLIIFASCKNETEKIEENPLKKQIALVKDEFAPDKRVALFDINSVKNNNQIILKGTSNLPEAVNTLKENLKNEKIAFVDSVQLYPDATLGGKTKAVVKISVANLRSNPKHSAELSTQATLGTPLNVFTKEDNWYLVQTPDKYLAWVDSGGIELMNDEEFATWKLADKIIFLNTYGQSFKNVSKFTEVVSDLVAGNILEVIEKVGLFYKVKYPDGRIAFVEQSKTMKYNDWLESLKPTQESLVVTSKSLMGLPYLWGGTSSKGVDCSGFTKTIFFLNGLVLPRDASQQIHTGKLIDDDKSFDNMQPGDLLFFGKPATETTKERVIHVGMWIGNNQFIHSAGRVHISTFDKKSPDFDEYNYNRYLRTKRILNENDPAIIDLTKARIFKD